MEKFKVKYKWKERKAHFAILEGFRAIWASMVKQSEDVLRYGMFDSCCPKRETLGVESLIAPGRSPVDPEPTRFEGEGALASRGTTSPRNKPGEKKGGGDDD